MPIYYENLRPVKHYKELNDGVIRIDPWSPSEGGTYDDPVVTRDDANVYFLYRDGTGRPWIEIYECQGCPVKYLTSDDFDNPSRWGIPGFGGDRLTYIWSGDGGPIQGAWRPNEEGEEPVGRVESHVEQSPPLEETTPLFGPQEPPTPEPHHDPWDQPREGHWDPVGLRWVYDEPTMKSAGILDDGHTGPRGEMRLAADQESSAADHQTDLDDLAGPLRRGHGDPAALDTSLQWVDENPTTVEGTAGGHKADLGDEVAGPLRSGHWDPAALRFVYDEPTMRSAGILNDESEDTQVPVDEGGAGRGVDPSSPSAEGEGGAAGIGVPYQDYIPFYPMVQDPATGEWRNAEPGEVSGPEGSGSTTPGSPHMLSNLFDPSAPGPTLDSDLFNPNAPGPTLDPALFDHNAPGPTLDPSLLDPTAPGPTLNPALLDSTAPGPTIDHALLDPGAPGATIDPSLLDSNWPGPTLDPNQLDPSAPGPTLDPAQLEHGIAHPGASHTEPTGVTDHPGFTDPSLTEVGHHESSTPAHDLDDPSALG